MIYIHPAEAAEHCGVRTGDGDCAKPKGHDGAHEPLADGLGYFDADDTLAQAIADFPAERHVFVRRRGVASCARCGVCWQRDESKNERPCKGFVRVTTR